MKSCRKILFFFFLFSFSFINAQSNWLWEVSGKGEGSVNSVVAFTGGFYFSGLLPINSIKFGNYTLINSNYPNSGDNESYIVKYDQNRNVLWAKQTLNINHNYLAVTPGDCSISADGKGNIYANGNFPDSLVIGADTLIANMRSSASFTTYLAKYDQNGNVLWSKEAMLRNDSSGIAGMAITSDKYGNTWITGAFADTVLFGPQILASANANQIYCFLVKYDSSGNCKWARQSSGNTRFGSTSWAVTSDREGNSIMTGYFEDSVVFGSYRLGANILSETDGDFFIAKYDSLGNVAWAKTALLASAKSGCKGWTLVTDEIGNIYVAGNYTDTITLGSVTLFGTVYSNIFLAKYDPNGNVVWAKTSKGLNINDWGVGSISIDNSKQIYLSGGGGRGNCKIAFGADTLSTIDTAKYDAASIILKFDSNGNVLCGSIIQGGDCVWNYVSSDTSGQFVYFGASTATPMVFGNDTVNPFSIQPNPGNGFNTFPFVARWEECDKSLGVNNIVVNNAVVRVYPNPNSGSFTISLKNIKNKCDVEIYNVLGENIYGTKLNTGNTEINLSGQPNGIYMYRVTTEDEGFVGSGKVVVEK